jgi:hypothetical protein
MPLAVHTVAVNMQRPDGQQQAVCGPATLQGGGCCSVTTQCMSCHRVQLHHAYPDAASCSLQYAALPHQAVAEAIPPVQCIPTLRRASAVHSTLAGASWGRHIAASETWPAIDTPPLVLPCPTVHHTYIRPAEGRPGP